jgi:hypothetical protein
MGFDTEEILSILDRCCEASTFPMLDNGYVYLAATRLSLHRSAVDWAMVIEVFGFSPRSGLPDTHIYTFGSRLHDRNPPEKYVTPAAHEMYLAAHPHDESRFVFPVEDAPWRDAEDDEFVAQAAGAVVVRGGSLPLPAVDEYSHQAISLAAPPQIQVFELCRFLGATLRDQVLATPQERRISVRPDMTELLVLEEWHHPDVVNDDRPSASESFHHLARVLVTGDIGLYRPSTPPNTHWRNWPDGGAL